ncbi:MAG: hypothetical protein ACP5JY_00910 [Candidatus Nanoarchaeia archaeon]
MANVVNKMDVDEKEIPKTLLEIIGSVDWESKAFHPIPNGNDYYFVQRGDVRDSKVSILKIDDIFYCKLENTDEIYEIKNQQVKKVEDKGLLSLLNTFYEQTTPLDIVPVITHHRSLFGLGNKIIVSIEVPTKRYTMNFNSKELPSKVELEKILSNSEIPLYLHSKVKEYFERYNLLKKET